MPAWCEPSGINYVTGRRVVNKSEAIARAGGLERLDTKYVQFSNINVAKDVWWLDLPLSRLDEVDIKQIDLLLFDDRYDELHHLVVPTAYLRENLSRLTVRDDKNCIRLEL